MAKSRGKPRKPRPVAVVRSVPSEALRRPKHQYDVGQLVGDKGKIGGLLFGGQAAPDLMVEMLPPLLFLNNVHGSPGNVCVEGAIVLHHCYEQLGITAQPVAVDLVTHDQRTGARTMYGRPDPSWEGDKFIGHCVVWLPGSSRIIDATVEQYPEVRRYRLGPIVGRMAAVGGGTAESRAAVERGELVPGFQVGVQREELLLVYTAVSRDFDGIVFEGEPIRRTAEHLRRAGINLATQVVALFRIPEVRARLRRAPYPRLHALLDAVGPFTPDVPADRGGASRDRGGLAVLDENDNLRLTVDVDGVAVDVLLDELDVPGDLPRPRVTPSQPVARLHDLAAGPAPQEIESVLADTAANARAVVSASAAMGGGPEPVLLFEPAQAVGMVADGGRTTEMQAEAIIARGFARFLPDLAEPPPSLPHWRVTQREDHVDLWEDDGLWASSPLRLDDEWLAAAREHGRVRVIYGTGVGVRVPPGRSEQQYTDHDRDTELAANRRRGIAATAVIAWT